MTASTNTYEYTIVIYFFGMFFPTIKGIAVQGTYQVNIVWSKIFEHIERSYMNEGPGGSMSWVVGLPNNSYKSITNTAWVRDRLCKLQKRVHSTRSRK